MNTQPPVLMFESFAECEALKRIGSIIGLKCLKVKPYPPWILQESLFP